MSRRWLPLGLVALLPLGLTAGQGSAIASPDADPMHTHTTADVSGLSSDDAWSVGTYRYPEYHSRAWVRHWDGVSWSQVRVPRPPDGELNSVSAVSPDDVWAVGNYDRGGVGISSALAMHWDGTKWTQVPMPRPNDFNDVHGVDGYDANDAWAVGANENCLTMHWDGIKWRCVKDASAGEHADLFSVTMLSPTDVYAAGQIFEAGNQPFVEHWDGTQWTRQTVVNSPFGTYFFGIDADAAGDVWAAGVSKSRVSYLTPAVARLHGDVWRFTKTADIGEHQSMATDVAVGSGDDVWMVGWSNTDLGQRPLTEHWDGRQWTAVHAPGKAKGSILEGVAVVAPGTFFACGEYNAGPNKSRSLEESWDGSRWRLMP